MTGARDAATAIASIIGFWSGAGEKGLWFAKDAAFDTRFRESFLELHMQAAARRHDGWMATAEGALALLILLDQFPRNAFRGTGHMYATDPLARHLAHAAQSAGHMERVEPNLRLFFCLPFAHSEELSDQERCVALCAALGETALSHAAGHRDIIRRFGRFPHRNPILGRATTEEEAAFLQAGGFAG